MFFKNSDTDQLSIREIDEKIKQTREQISKVESVYTGGKWTFIVCIILALIFVCISYPDLHRFFDLTPDPIWLGPPVRREDILMDVLGIPLFLLFPFIFLLKSKAGVEVDGGVQAFFLFGVALVAECCGIYYGNDGFALCACWAILLAALALGGLGSEVLEGSLSWILLGAVLCYSGNDIFRFFGHVHDKNPECCSFILWGYVIVVFGVTIFAAWRFKITYNEEGDRLRELIREYEKKDKGEKSFESEGGPYDFIPAKKTSLEENLRVRIAEEGWGQTSRQEEALSDDEKLKRAIDRFRVPSPPKRRMSFSPPSEGKN